MTGPFNPYFNNTPSETLTEEQLLYEDLICEQISMWGAKAYYLFRESADEIDDILGEDPTTIFQTAHMIPVFIDSMEDWTGGAEMFSKFGLIINRQNTIILTRRHFNQYIGTSISSVPREGDLIYIPTFEKMFEIKKIETSDKNFYPLGRKQAYIFTLYLEMFKYSHEPFDTGIDELDILEVENSYSIQFHLSTGTGTYWNNEIVYQGSTYDTATATAQVKSIDSANNILSVYNIKGEFANSSNIVGVSSAASWIINDYDDKEEHEDYRWYQNADIEASANTNLDTSESNPFGGV